MSNQPGWLYFYFINYIYQLQLWNLAMKQLHLCMQLCTHQMTIVILVFDVTMSLTQQDLLQITGFGIYHV